MPEGGRATIHLPGTRWARGRETDAHSPAIDPLSTPPAAGVLVDPATTTPARAGALDAVRTAQTALLCAALAALVALATHVLGPPAGDAPAHIFQTLSFARHGYALWDNYWYAGYYQYVLYSAVYYPVAAIGGIVPVAVASASFAAWAFASAAGRLWGLPARLPSLAFAATAPTIVMVSGMYPFGAGVAVACMVLVLLQRRHTVAAAIAIVAVPAFSPLAFLLLLVVLAAAFVTSPSPRRTLRANRWPTGAVVGALVAAAALKLVFAQPGYYPFSAVDLATALGFSAVGLALAHGRLRRDFLSALFVLYGLVNVLLFLVPSPVGANATRLYSIAALPLLWLASRSRRPALRGRWVLAILTVAFVAQAAPYAASAYRSYQDSTTASAPYWKPALTFLRGHADAGYRVEVVATSGHWEAYYLARAGVPLARGWYRQADFPQNTVLYQPTISAAAYQAWLRSLGIKYVLLPDVPLDYSSQAEAALIRSGTSGLAPAGSAPHWRFYRLPDAVGIVSGLTTQPLDVHVTSAAISFAATRAGNFTIRVRYSPYWRTSTPTCLTETAGGMTSVRVDSPGVVSLSMPDPLDAVFGSAAPATTTCPAGA